MWTDRQNRGATVLFAVKAASFVIYFQLNLQLKKKTRQGYVMNPLNVIRGFDPDLYSYFEKELEHQRLSLSFIPDENSTSPLCAAIMGSVLVNTSKVSGYRLDAGLESLTAKRICDLFKADHANLRTISIEAASRCVFQSLTKRGDIVMSLDLRKKEHCNSESLAYRFVNFSIDPKTQRLDMDAIEKQAKACMPQMIIVSPINYPLEIDYARFAHIAKECHALLWCDISQIAGLIAGGALPSPVPHADVVTFSCHGSLQGPQASVILCRENIANAIDRSVYIGGHTGLQTAQLAALEARIGEMAEPIYAEYAKAVVNNAKALGEGLKQGGLNFMCQGSDSHLILVDSKDCALSSARGAQEMLADAGVNVRICSIETADPEVKFDAIRFSTLAPTTRGATAAQMREVGGHIAQFLRNPNNDNLKVLRDKITRITVGLPTFFEYWLSPIVRDNLTKMSFMSSDSTQIADSIHPTRLQTLTRKFKERKNNN